MKRNIARAALAEAARGNMKSRILTCIAALAVFAALGIQTRLAAQQTELQEKQTHYYVQDLGVLGGTGATAETISNRGWVVGTSNLAGDATVHSYLWRDGKMSDLGTLGGLNSAEYGTGLAHTDHAGLITGSAQTSAIDPLGEAWGQLIFFCNNGPCQGYQNVVLGFLWQDDVMTALPTLGGNNGQGLAINGDGQVVGWAENSVHDPTCAPLNLVLDYEPVIWNRRQDGEIHIHELSRIPGDTNGQATAINDRGQVTGFSSDCPQSYAHAVIWQHGAVTDMGNIGGKYNFPTSINSAGQVVGQASRTGDTTLTSFLWQEDGGMTDLGMLPGDVWSSAWVITRQGKVLGTSCSQLFFNNCRAFIWQDGVMTDLNTLVKPGSTPLQLFFANDINSHGEIAAYAFNPSNGEFRAAVAIPCDEEHADNEGCADSAEGATAIRGDTSERAKVALPENVRKQLQQRRGFGRFAAGNLGCIDRKEAT